MLNWASHTPAQNILDYQGRFLSNTSVILRVECGLYKKNSENRVLGTLFGQKTFTTSE